MALRQRVVQRWRYETAPRLARCSSALPPGAPGTALTFDDGPDPVFTPRVLDLLAEHGVRATFFVIGERALREPELVRRAAREGHAVGSHTWSHVDPQSIGLRETLAQVRRGRRAVEQVLGRPVPLFRPPMGHVGAGTVAAVRAARVRPWLWTVDPHDWRPGATAEQVLEAAAAARSGDVVLLHDGIALPPAPEALDRSATVAALEQLLGLAHEDGRSFVRLPP